MPQKIEGDSYLSPRTQGGEQKHITPNSCSRVKPKMLKEFEATAHVTLLFQNNLKPLFQHSAKQNLVALARLSTKLSNFL